MLFCLKSGMVSLHTFQYCPNLPQHWGKLGQLTSFAQKSLTQPHLHFSVCSFQHIRAPLCKKKQTSEYVPENLNYDQNTKKCLNLPHSHQMEE